MGKTFYLWDLADTLFPERWDVEKSGVMSFDAYVESLGYNLKTVSPHDYEWAYERPYSEGLFELTLPEGFKEVLTWTKNNGVFTTGNREQIDWRAEQLQRKYGFDIRDYIGEIRSTFDYGNTNQKTPEMLTDILKKKYAEGFDTIIYTDDKEKNCQFLGDAIKRLCDEGIPLKTRVYHLRNDHGRLEKRSDEYFEVGNLPQLLEYEKAIAKT